MTKLINDHLFKIIGALCVAIASIMAYGFIAIQDVSANTQKGNSTVIELHRHIDQQMIEMRELRADVIKIKVKVGAE